MYEQLENEKINVVQANTQTTYVNSPRRQT